MSNAPERTPSDYPVLLRSLPAVDGGGYLAMVPDLPRCVSDGDTPAQAFANAQEAIAESQPPSTSAGQFRTRHRNRPSF